MPIPKPRAREGREAFLSRCMGNATMRADFPDRDQRFAVCSTQWRERNKDIRMHTNTDPFEPWSEDGQTKMLTFDAEIKADEDEAGVFEGMASTFGNIDLVGDRIRRGAFKESLRNRRPRQIKMLWQHDMREPIGVWEEIRETRQGLFAKGRLILEGVPNAVKAHALMKAGAIDSLSIGFRVPEGGSEVDKDGGRILKEVDLLEISVVTIPANPKAEINRVKTLLHEDGFPTEREFERLLVRDVGFSQSEAKTIICHGFRHLQTRRDVGMEDADEVIALMRASLAKARERHAA